MAETILGETPQVPDDVWSAALARAVDPDTSFDPTLLPDETQPLPVESDSADLDDTEEPALHDTIDDPYTAPDPTAESVDSGGSFDDTDTDPFGID